MAIKWGSSNVTAVKWGSTNITKVLWGSTQVFPDLLVIFNGGNASSTFTGRTHESGMGGWGGSSSNYGWVCYSVDNFIKGYPSWSTKNPGYKASFSLTNGLSADCWRTVTWDSENGTRCSVGYVKFMTNNKVNLTNKTTIEITITTQAHESYGSVPIYVAGVNSLTNNKAVWCVIAWAALHSTSTRSITIPAANRNADCYLAVATTYTSESGGEEYDNYGQGRPSTITKITSY